ncbi:MAG: nucleotidyltransferase domain-containing protein [Planctomycetes bacterium]|nr:nucleotidyltransferase domain-containing protein [Planctomycetota bacterium]
MRLVATLGQLDLTERERAAIEEFGRRIVEGLPGRVERIVLYGSKARGDWNQDSDVDLLVLVRGDWRDAQRLASALSVDAHLDHGVFLSAKAIALDHFERMLEEGWSFYRAVQSEGVEVWRKP